MKKLLLILVCAFGMMSFTIPEKADAKEKIITEEANLTYKVEYKQIACDYYSRTCTYRNGELESCSEWECGYRLDEVVVEG